MSELERLLEKMIECGYECHMEGHIEADEIMIEITNGLKRIIDDPKVTDIVDRAIERYESIIND